jgi:hypothetical protein
MIQDNTIVVGTEFGVFATTDGGDSIGNYSNGVATGSWI